MLRFAAALGLCALPLAVAADAGRTVAGTWTLEQGAADAAYRLASRGVSGDFLICFDSGNVRRVAVAVGDERSVLARGARRGVGRGVACAASEGPYVLLDLSEGLPRMGEGQCRTFAAVPGV
jgi:hypothetical protein